VQTTWASQILSSSVRGVEDIVRARLWLRGGYWECPNVAR